MNNRTVTASKQIIKITRNGFELLHEIFEDDEVRSSTKISPERAEAIMKAWNDDQLPEGFTYGHLGMSESCCWSWQKEIESE